ncbi:MAG: DUF881 domain-containing protein [Caulobacteraceae bacterium]
MNKTVLRYYLFALAVIIGFITTVQFKTNVTYQGIITIPKLLDLQNELNNVEKENKKLNESISEDIAQLAEYKTSIENTGSVYSNMQDELAKMQNYSDYEKVQGPGVIITLNDSQQEIAEDQNVLWYLIHDIDILEIVNELRIAGAEAISINEERVTATTNIRCGGPTINIDGKRHAVPFVIKAIGDPKTLEASLLAPESYIDIMEYSGIMVDVQKAEKIIIKGYDGENKLKYQRKAEGGEAK